MDIFKIQSLITKGKIVSSADIDPENSYLQIGIYQPGNRKKGASDANAYPSYAMPLSELAKTSLSAIHIPFSDDKPNPYMGFARGVKLRTNIFNYTQSNDGNSYVSMPPGFEVSSFSVGLVYGESSIKKFNEKPKVINGLEQKLTLNFNGAPGYGESGFRIEFIKSLIENSEEKDIQMEYLSHEGQAIVNIKPIVYFDGTYITVDARETDILEDTFLWYVIRNVANTSIDLAIQIFVSNCECEWPQDKPESAVSAIFNKDSSYKTTFIEKNNLLLNKFNDYITTISTTPIDCTLLNSLNNDIKTVKLEVDTASSDWEANNQMLTNVDPPVYENAFDVFNQRIQCFLSQQLDIYNAVNSAFDTFECMFKDSLGVQDDCGATGGYTEWGVTNNTIMTDNTDFLIRNFIPDYLVSLQATLDNDTQINKEILKKIKDFYLEKRHEYTDVLYKCVIKSITVKKLRGAAGDYTSDMLINFPNDIDVLTNFYGC